MSYPTRLGIQKLITEQCIDVCWQLIMDKEKEKNMDADSSGLKQIYADKSISLVPTVWRLGAKLLLAKAGIWNGKEKNMNTSCAAKVFIQSDYAGTGDFLLDKMKKVLHLG